MYSILETRHLSNPLLFQKIDLYYRRPFHFLPTNVHLNSGRKHMIQFLFWFWYHDPPLSHPDHGPILLNVPQTSCYSSDPILEVLYSQIILFLLLRLVLIRLPDNFSNHFIHVSFPFPFNTMSWVSCLLVSKEEWRRRRRVKRRKEPQELKRGSMKKVRREIALQLCSLRFLPSFLSHPPLEPLLVHFHCSLAPFLFLDQITVLSHLKKYSMNMFIKNASWRVIYCCRKGRGNENGNGRVREKKWLNIFSFSSRK